MSSLSQPFVKFELSFEDTKLLLVAVHVLHDLIRVEALASFLKCSVNDATSFLNIKINLQSLQPEVTGDIPDITKIGDVIYDAFFEYAHARNLLLPLADDGFYTSSLNNLAFTVTTYQHGPSHEPL